MKKIILSKVERDRLVSEFLETNKVEKLPGELPPGFLVRPDSKYYSDLEKLLAKAMKLLRSKPVEKAKAVELVRNHLDSVLATNINISDKASFISENSVVYASIKYCYPKYTVLLNTEWRMNYAG